LVKTLQKYSTRLDELIALDPSLLQNQEEVENAAAEENANEGGGATDGAAASAASADETAVGNVTAAAGNMTARMNVTKKRALFNETCNTLLDLTKANEQPPGSPSRGGPRPAPTSAAAATSGSPRQGHRRGDGLVV